MNIVIWKNKKPKKPFHKEKMRLILSFFVIVLALCLLVYAISNNEPIALLVVIIVVVKITDIALNLNKIHRKTQITNYRKFNTAK